MKTTSNDQIYVPTQYINNFSKEEIYLFCNEPEFFKERYYDPEAFWKLNYLFENDERIQKTFLKVPGVKKEAIEHNLALFEQKKLGVTTIRDKIMQLSKGVWDWLTKPDENPEPVPAWIRRLSAAFQFLIIPVLSFWVFLESDAVEKIVGTLIRKEMALTGELSNLNFLISSIMGILLYYVIYFKMIFRRKGESLALFLLNILPIFSMIGLILQKYFYPSYETTGTFLIFNYKKLDYDFIWYFFIICSINILLYIPIQKRLKKENRK
jgi:hypothetical protein